MKTISADPRQQLLYEFFKVINRKRFWTKYLKNYMALGHFNNIMSGCTKLTKKNYHIILTQLLELQDDNSEFIQQLSKKGE